MAHGYSEEIISSSSSSPIFHDLLLDACDLVNRVYYYFLRKQREKKKKKKKKESYFPARLPLYLELLFRAINRLLRTTAGLCLIPVLLQKMHRLWKSLLVFGGCCWATVQAQRHRLEELVPEGCPVCECPSVSAQPDDEEVTTVQILVFDSPGIIAMVKENAQDYEALHNNTIRIQVRTTPTMPELYAEIESDARSGGGLFDAYFTNPIIIGTAAVLGGFLDLAPFIKKDGAEWTDVLPVFRTHVTNFQDKIYMILLDGDIHALFYRRDVLEHFGLTVPRTWDEYIHVAKSVHGKVYNNITLSGSCISRIYGDHAQYWAHLVLATITQTKGTAQGSLFDTKDLTPLTGEAMAEMLRIHEEMATYGTPDGT